MTSYYGRVDCAWEPTAFEEAKVVAAEAEAGGWGTERIEREFALIVARHRPVEGADDPDAKDEDAYDEITTAEESNRSLEQLDQTRTPWRLGGLDDGQDSEVPMLPFTMAAYFPGIPLCRSPPPPPPPAESGSDADALRVCMQMGGRSRRPSPQNPLPLLRRSCHWCPLSFATIEEYDLHINYAHWLRDSPSDAGLEREDRPWRKLKYEQKMVDGSPRDPLPKLRKLRRRFSSTVVGYGQDGPRKGSALNLGVALWPDAQLRGVASLLREYVQVHKEHLGVGHSHTLCSQRPALGSALGQAPETLVEGLELLRATMNTQRRLSGSSSLETLGVAKPRLSFGGKWELRGGGGRIASHRSSGTLIGISRRRPYASGDWRSSARNGGRGAR